MQPGRQSLANPARNFRRSRGQPRFQAGFRAVFRYPERRDGNFLNSAQMTSAGVRIEPCFDAHDGADPALRNAEALRRFGDEGGKRIGWNRADDLRCLAECGCGRAELDQQAGNEKRGETPGGA